MMNQSSGFIWGSKPPDLEEGEVSDGLSSEEDYSPGSLVIDTQDQGATLGVSSHVTSGPPTPPIEMLQSNLQEYDAHPIFSIITSPSSTPPTDTMSQSQPSSSPSFPQFSTFVSSPSPLPTITSDIVPLPASLPQLLAPLPTLSVGSRDEGSGKGERVVFLTKIEVLAEGSAPVDTLCIYSFKWGAESIEVLTRQNRAPLIPVKNVYLKAIPGLKQNVLSARISKLGIRSLVLSEPYVSTVKKLNLGLNGSSHYITVPDFIKICNYFKRQAPSFVTKFDIVTSVLSPESVLQLFNDPDNPASQILLSQLSEEAGKRKTGGAVIPGIGGGASIRGSGSPSHSRTHSEGNNMDGTFNFSDVDARRLALPNGSSIFVLVKEGVIYLPNPELAKILPAVSRTAMDHIRNSYGITVTQANKTDMGVLKYLGVVSMKAGRTLLYKVKDVATMFNHWKSTIPEFIKEMIRGKIPEEKIVIDTSCNYQGFPMVSMSPTGSRTPSPHRTHQNPSSASSAVPNSALLSSQVASNHAPPQISHTHFNQDGGFSSGNIPASASSVFRSTVGSSVRRQKEKTIMSDISPIGQHGNLTPDKFQLPVQMLNSFTTPAVSSHMTGSSGHMTASGHMITSSGHMTASSGHHVMDSSSHLMMGSSNHMPGGPAHQTSSVTIGQAEYYSHPKDQPPPQKVSKRRTSVSGSPLDDTNLDYSTLMWGDVSLTMLCPKGEEPYLAMPELVQKVFRYRSYVSIDQRARLGVIIHPASSIQIHALRARGSLDSFTGNVKLISLSNAVKLAVNGNFQIPGSVIQTLTAQSKVPVQQILNPITSTIPTVVMPTNIEHGHEKQEKQEMTSSSSTEGNVPPIPIHPDINPAPPDWRIDGSMCGVKWGKNSIAVYITNTGKYCVGLYQVYDVLFKRYVTRMNFKMRMRKLDIRSSRAPSSVRLKLVELGALPAHCPVCGLITLREMERLAKSYGVEPPPVFYEKFLSGKSEQKVISQVTPHPPLPSHTQNYGIVPYLKSSRERTEEDSNMTSPNLITTSLGTKFTNQIHLMETDKVSTSLIISISRDLTPFKVSQPTNSYASLNTGPLPLSSKRPHPHPYGGPRGDVLKNLAKRISQKSRKYTNTLNAMRTSAQNSSPLLPDPSSGGTRVCPSCGQANPQHKKRCGFCNEFIVGTPCPSCSVLNYYRSKNCMKCGTTMPYAWTSTADKDAARSHDRSHDQGEASGSGMSDSSSHPTSPLSPKYSAPPIRSAVLKSLFPQQQDRPSDPPADVGSKIAGGTGQQQLVTKTVFPPSSRKCQECGQLNSRMAKKCVQCRGHLQGRACIRCGRPNLNHVTECYKCGATLPSASSSSSSSTSKWVYAGSHSGRAYKSTATVQTIETKVLLSRAPIACLRCNKFRSSGYFKCGRCGDAFRVHPLVDPPWEDKDPPPPPKKRKESFENKEEESDQRKKINSVVFSDLACNLLSLGLQEQLVPLIQATLNESQDKLGEAQQEFEAAEEEYEVALVKKQGAEEDFKNVQAELDGLLAQVEGTNKKLGGVIEREEAAKKEVETLPTEIESLKAKIEASTSLLLPNEI